MSTNIYKCCLLLRYNMKFNKYWFVPKKYGYGATPSTWEGWLFTFFIILLIILDAYLFIGRAPMVYFTLFFLIIVIFILVGMRKTKGSWKWRWG